MSQLDSPWHLEAFDVAAACACACLLLGVGACATTVNPVKVERLIGAPVLEPRAEGCSVDIVEEGTAYAKASREVGTVSLAWSTAQMREQGQAYAYKTLSTATCEAGAHAVLHLRALPRAFNEGMLFEGVLVVLLDSKGEPLVGRATGTAQSGPGLGSSVPDAGP